MSFSDHTQKPANLLTALESLDHGNQIQQLKAIGSQRRLASSGPNVVISTQRRPGIPSHVVGVAARTFQISPSTTNLTLTFGRDPSDQYHKTAKVYVSGYKGNPAPVHVASGDSPISFALDTTSENISVAVVSSGDLGDAYLATAPTAAVRLGTNPTLPTNNTRPATAPPDAPPTPTATATALGNVISWTAPSTGNLMAYEVYRATSNSFSAASKIGNIVFAPNSRPSFVDKAIVANTAYFYFITAVSTSFIESAASSSATCTAANANLDSDVSDGSAFLRSPVFGGTAIVVENSNFESSGSILPPPGWSQGSAAASTYSYETGTPYQGSRSLKIVTALQFGGICSSRKFAAKSGDSYYIQAALKSDGTAQIGFQLWGFDASGTFTEVIGTGGTTSTSWTVLSTTGTFANANTVGFFINPSIANVGGGTAWVDSISVARRTDIDTELRDGSNYLRTSKNANTGGGGFSVVPSTVAVSNAITSPTGSGTFTTGTPCFVSGQAYVSNSIVDIYIDCGSNTGYFVRIDGRISQYTGTILKVTNVTTSGWAIIGTNYGSTNPAAFTGWHRFEAFIGNNGYMQLWIDGVLAADVTDTTYTPNGNLKYGFEVSAGKLGPGIVNLSGSTHLNAQGSLCNISAYNFSYTSTTTSVTWSWGAFTIYFLDGGSISVGASSQAAFTGLTASNTYFFGIYYDLISGTPVVVKSDVSSGTGQESTLQLAQTINGDTHVPIITNVSAATPASGSGGGSGGGGSRSCFSPNTKVKTQRGDVRMDGLTTADEVLTAAGTWRKVLAVIHRPYSGAMLAMGNCEFVTPTHLFLVDGRWIPSVEAHPDFGPCNYDGTIWNVLVDANDDWMQPTTEHSYTLSRGDTVHNPLT